MKTQFIALWLFAAVLLTSAVAQEAKTSGTEQAFTTKVIDVWPGVAPGSEQWKQQETVLGSGSNQRIVNVTKPTLTVYLPPPSTATGAAVIIAPGGGFVYLTIDSEGHDVAKWLVARGIAAIVLKYRVIQKIYLWEEGNVPTTTEYTENNSGYFDPPDFRPNMVYFPAKQGVEVKGAVLVCRRGRFSISQQ